MIDWTESLSGNHGGKRLHTKYVVVHYTADDRADVSIGWLRAPASHASANLVIDQDGHTTLLVPLDTVAWHCGASEYRGERGLNALSIGVELVNPGPVTSIGNQRYAAQSRRYTEDEVEHAAGKTWAKYPAAQIGALVKVVQECCKAYGPLELVGHSDICMPRGRKLDPGPAFPWHDFNSLAQPANT